jgi:hypothetical protein
MASLTEGVPGIADPRRGIFAARNISSAMRRTTGGREGDTLGL